MSANVGSLIDGLYSVTFGTATGHGDGVIVLTGEDVRGGDASFAYFGKLIQHEDGFSAQIRTKRHANGRPSVFGKETVTIILTGKWTGDHASCIGNAKEVPGLVFRATLVRID